MTLTLHRKDKEFKDDGKSLTYQPGQEQVFKVTCRKRLEFLRYTNPVAFSDLAARTTVELVKWLIEQNSGQPVELSTVLQEGSHKIGVSMETVKRYVITHSAMGAELKRDGKRVKLNPYFKPDDEEDDGKDE